jgi:hypothetical protein
MRNDFLQKNNEVPNDRASIIYLSGIFIGLLNKAEYTQDFREVKLFLMLLADMDSESLAELPLYGIRPFETCIVNRKPDSRWEETMVSSDHDVVIDCPCGVENHYGKVYVNWTIPRYEFILECEDNEKLKYCMMIVIEEFFHIRQLNSPTSATLINLGINLSLDAFSDLSRMSSEDRALFTQIIESDITYFLGSNAEFGYGRYIPNLPESLWYKKRFEGDSEHRPLTPVEMVERIIYLAENYGYPDEVAQELADNLPFVTRRCPELAAEIYGSQAYIDFIAKYKLA